MAGDYPNGVTLSIWIVSGCVEHGADTPPDRENNRKSNHFLYRCGDLFRSAHGTGVADMAAQTPPDLAARKERFIGMRTHLISPRLEEARVLHEISIKAREDRWETKATRFARKALAILERDHSDAREIAKVLISLAAAYLDCGDHSRAEASYRRAGGLLEAMSEAECLETKRLQIEVARGLARVVCAQGHGDQAEAILKDSLLTAERAFGHQHATVALVLNELGAVCRQTRRFDSAYKLHRNALAITSRVLGTVHPQAADILDNLTALEVAAGRGRRAEPFARLALAIREQTLGPDHPRVGTAAASLASILEGRDCDQAEALYRRALTIFERWFGKDHPEVALIANSLASLIRPKASAAAILTVSATG
jgi:tetratricopeptide (TPR) repeat protein